MKKIFILCIGLLMSAQLFGGFGSTERSKCGTFIWKKYSCNARVFTGLFYWQASYNCGQAYAEKIKNCAWQRVSRGDSGFWEQGGVRNRFCSRGEEVSLFDKLLIPQNQNNLGYIEESEISAAPSIFDTGTNSIHLKDLNGKISLAKYEGYYSDFRITIWKPSDDIKNGIEDTIKDPNEILHTLTIKVTDNGTLITGDLATRNVISNINTVQLRDEVLVNFSNINLDIPIDPSINVNDLAITYEGDGAPDTEKNTERVIEETDKAIALESIDLRLYKKDYNSIELLTSLKNAEKIGEIKVFSLSGKEEKIDFENIYKDKDAIFKADVSKLKAGPYFVYIVIDGKKYLRKFMR